MLLLVEPISKNIDMYIPAYPLPIMEIASFVKAAAPEVEVRIVSIPGDYGLPLNREGRKRIYDEFLKDCDALRPTAVGISCTAIAQAEETIHLCELIKAHDPGIFVFLGGYFPTVYYEEIFSRTEAVDLIVTGEGEIPTLSIIRALDRGEIPMKEDIPGLVWAENGRVHFPGEPSRFDLNRKATINLDLLRRPRGYDILPYAFSRGCPYKCSFCMEEFIRPVRREVPRRIIHEDLTSLSLNSDSTTLLISDALFRSFDLFPFIRSLNMNVNFETRCDVLDPAILAGIADLCGTIAVGFESASYDSLRRMNKVKDRAHYERYISGAEAIFREAVTHGIPIMVFMIAGYPGDTEQDLRETLRFAEKLARHKGPGGHIFKVGECRVYPKTPIYRTASASPDVEFDDEGVFGENIVRKPSRHLGFDTVLRYMREIFELSNHTPKILDRMSGLMPFFRVPARILTDEVIPDLCFRDEGRTVFSTQPESLGAFRRVAPEVLAHVKGLMAGQRRSRDLPF